MLGHVLCMIVVFEDSSCLVTHMVLVLAFSFKI
jgi:hypothetical protein